MTRILLRAPSSPFDVHSVETTIERNLIATNAGNLVFLDAAWKLLSAPGVEITRGRPGGRPADADRINERYDVVRDPARERVPEQLRAGPREDDPAGAAAADPGRGARGRGAGHGRLRLLGDQADRADGPRVHGRGPRPVAVGRGARRGDARLPERAGVPRRRRRRLPVDVHVGRRPPGGTQGAGAGRALEGRHHDLAVPHGDGPDRAADAGPLSAPRLRRAGPRHAAPARGRDAARGRHARRRVAAPPAAPVLPRAPDPVLHRAVVVDRRPASGGLRVRHPDPRRDRGAAGRDAGHGARPRLADARARALLRDPAPPPA